jgi:hypothetical protein
MFKTTDVGAVADIRLSAKRTSKRQDEAVTSTVNARHHNGRGRIEQGLRATREDC